MTCSEGYDPGARSLARAPTRHAESGGIPPSRKATERPTARSGNDEARPRRRIALLWLPMRPSQSQGAGQGSPRGTQSSNSLEFRLPSSVRETRGSCASPRRGRALPLRGDTGPAPSGAPPWEIPHEVRVPPQLWVPTAWSHHTNGLRNARIGPDYANLVRNVRHAALPGPQACSRHTGSRDVPGVPSAATGSQAPASALASGS